MLNMFKSINYHVNPSQNFLTDLKNMLSGIIVTWEASNFQDNGRALLKYLRRNVTETIKIHTLYIWASPEDQWNVLYSASKSEKMNVSLTTLYVSTSKSKEYSKARLCISREFCRTPQRVWVTIMANFRKVTS